MAKRKSKRRANRKMKQIHGEGVVRDVLEGVGGSVGGALGASAGGAVGGTLGFEAGLLTGPGAIVASPLLAEEGAVAGATLGGTAGAVGGAKLGSKVADFLGFGHIHGKGLSARPIQAIPKGAKIRRPQPTSTILVNKNGRISKQSFNNIVRGKRMRMKGRGKAVRQGTFGTVSSEFGKVNF